MKKIKLSARYGKLTYVISSILTMAMSILVIFSPGALPECILLKLASIPVIFYLFSTLSRSQSIYFYINLGISRKEYYLIPFAVEFAGFAVMMTICDIIGYAIG